MLRVYYGSHQSVYLYNTMMSDNNDAHMKQSLDIHCVIAHKKIQGIVLTTL